MSIHVTNLSPGETLHHSLALILGEVTPPLSEASIVVRHHQGAITQAWPIFNGFFKVLVPLSQGDNHIQLLFYDELLDFHLFYKVPPFVRFVRPVYIVAADDEGCFHGPDWEDCSPASAVERIAFGSKLLQTFTAEKLAEHGLGRRNFILETDLFPDRPPCHIFKSRIKKATAHAMSGADLWIYFAKELMSSTLFDRKDHTKWFAFISFTRYCPPEGVIPKTHSEVLKFTKGHTALGGGGLALFGTGNLHTWAERLEDLVPRFTDPRKIDRSLFMDDSAYRQTHWANYSTGLGAALHELGHTFDLAHTPTGVMARGFDDLYRVFTVQPLLTSRSSSRDSSYLASPIPYSPRQSPVHRPKPGSSSRANLSKPGSPIARSRTPKSLIATTPSGVATIPAVIQVETAFKRLSTASTQTFTVSNYDGSETKCTIIKNKDGTEIVTEVTSYPNGEKIAKEIIRNVTTGRTRTTMSMSTSSDMLSDLAKDEGTDVKMDGRDHANISAKYIDVTASSSTDQSDSDTASLTGGLTPTNEDPAKSHVTTICDKNKSASERSSVHKSESARPNVSHSKTSPAPPSQGKSSGTKSGQTVLKKITGLTIYKSGPPCTKTKGEHQRHPAVPSSVDSKPVSQQSPAKQTSVGSRSPGGHVEKDGRNACNVKSNGHASNIASTGTNSDAISETNGIHTSVSGSREAGHVSGAKIPTLALGGIVTSQGADRTSCKGGTPVPVKPGVLSASMTRCPAQSGVSKDNLSANGASHDISDTPAATAVSQKLRQPGHSRSSSSDSMGITSPGGDREKGHSRNSSITSSERTRTPSTSSSESFIFGGHSTEGISSDTGSASDTSETSSRHTMAATQPAQLPRSPEDETVPLLPFREVQYRDGGAHWYRASAVLLRYHKWLNPPHPKDPGKPPELHGLVLTCATGLRVIELRTLPDSVVFHHWEFLHKHPPQQFKLKYKEVMELARNATEVTLVAEDLYGNILKKKINLSQLKEPQDEGAGCSGDAVS